MKYSQARYGRVFVVRLEDGDVLHEEIEHLACEESIRAAAIIALGGADKGSTLVVGPKNGRGAPANPLEIVLDDVHEIVGTGTLFPDKDGKPVLHLHIAAGRENKTVAGCVRCGVKTWHVMEVILFELVGSTACRMPDPATGFELLQP